LIFDVFGGVQSATNGMTGSHSIFVASFALLGLLVASAFPSVPAFSCGLQAGVSMQGWGAAAGLHPHQGRIRGVEAPNKHTSARQHLRHATMLVASPGEAADQGVPGGMRVSEAPSSLLLDSLSPLILRASVLLTAPTEGGDALRCNDLPRLPNASQSGRNLLWMGPRYALFAHDHDDACCTQGERQTRHHRAPGHRSTRTQNYRDHHVGE
jgi:hypothetical protein